MPIRLRVWGYGCAAALFALTAAAGLVAQTSGSRTISLRNIHTDETISVEYKRAGRYLPDAMKRINWVMRDWRKDEATTMDPALIDLLWEMHAELGSKEPINVISGYRSRATNNMLRKTVGGQASQSRHVLGKAADVQFPDIPVRQLRYAALVRERGGVGYYPTSGTPFVHVDTDRVRAWPRLPRYELALLFPNGKTRHLPQSGGPITSADVRTARAKHAEAAAQIAAFHDMRRAPRTKTMVASLGGLPAIASTKPRPTARLPEPPPAEPLPGYYAPVTARRQPSPPPQLLVPPRLADRPARLAPRPSFDDRRKLTQLAALASIPVLVAEPTLARRPAPAGNHDPGASASLESVKHGPAPALAKAARAAGSLASPRLAFVSKTGMQGLQGWSTGWASAPARDDDHPEESAYRPFPLAPFLTATASIDDPALAQLVRPDFARTGELFDVSAAQPPMRLRPGRQISRLVWADQDGGGAALGRLGVEVRQRPTDLARKVLTEATNGP